MSPLKRLLERKRERVMGIGPTYPAWKAGVLPLNYTRVSKLPIQSIWNSNLSDDIKNYIIGVTGFEPAASWSQTRRSSQAEPHPVAS